MFPVDDIYTRSIYESSVKDAAYRWTWYHVVYVHDLFTERVSMI